MSRARREFNSVGCPVLPSNPELAEIVEFIRQKALWQEAQPYGREMDARAWAATCLNSVAENLEADHAEVRKPLVDALTRITKLEAEWSANNLGGVSIQRLRWKKLGDIAREATKADALVKVKQ